MSSVFFDTHVHFDGIQGDGPPAAIRRAIGADVTRMVAVGHSPEANRLAVALARQFPDNLLAAVGYDRDTATQGLPMGELEDLLVGGPIAAIGEIGLDFHYHPETAAAQEALFDSMLELARRHGRPVIVHSRDADEATVRHLAAHAARWSGDAARVGVLHCFTGSAEFARRVLDLGFYISFSGILTFKSAGALRDVARLVPGARRLIETDSPYLAPEPYRGRPNEPAYLPLVARSLAEVCGRSAEDIAEATTRNAEALFAPSVSPSPRTP